MEKATISLMFDMEELVGRASGAADTWPSWQADPKYVCKWA